MSLEVEIHSTQGSCHREGLPTDSSQYCPLTTKKGQDEDTTSESKRRLLVLYQSINFHLSKKNDIGWSLIHHSQF